MTFVTTSFVRGIWGVFLEPKALRVRVPCSFGCMYTVSSNEEQMETHLLHRYNASLFYNFFSYTVVGMPPYTDKDEGCVKR